MTDISYPKEVIKDLLEGKLPWERVRTIISDDKDSDRFDKYVEVMQDMMPWKERVLLPLTDKLLIAENKNKERIVKCRCGHEFGDYRENWKLKALIHVRDTQEEIKEIYEYPGAPDPAYCEIREYYCPTCASQLEVEIVPFGYPAVFDFLPDLDTFYGEWLGRPLETKKEFKDLTCDLTKKWAASGNKGKTSR